METDRVVSNLALLLNVWVVNIHKRGSVVSFIKVDPLSVVIYPVSITLEAMMALFELSGGGQQGLSNYTQLMNLLRGASRPVQLAAVQQLDLQGLPSLAAYSQDVRKIIDPRSHSTLLRNYELQYYFVN